MGKSLIEMQTTLFLEYANQMFIIFGNDKDDEYYSMLESKIIMLPKQVLFNPTKWSLFAFLHEIGHIVTNTSNMKRYEQEYLATQWAINKAKEIDFKIPKNYIDTYQKYIYKWRETSIKHKGKNIASKDSLKLTA